MPSPTARVFTAVCLICTWQWHASMCAASSAQEMAADSRSHVTTKRPYTINTDVTVSLELGQAAQLDVASNPYNLKQYILYYYAQADGRKVIRGDAYLTDGLRSGGGAWADLAGALRQVAYTRCLAIARWKVRDGRAQIEFCLCDDMERNHREYRQYKLADQTMSTQYNDKQLVPPVALPETDRLAGFVHLWSEAKFNFAFWDRVPEVNWDAVLVEYLPKVQQAKTDVEYYRVLRQCIALLRDGHTGVWGPSDEPDGRPPVEIAAVQGKAVIVQVYPAEQIRQPGWKAELLAAHLVPGDEITHVDGRAVERILAEDLYPFIAASTPQHKELQAYPKLATGNSATRVLLRVRDLQENEREVSLTRGHYSFPRREEPFLCELPDGIVRINFNSFGSDEAVKQFEKAFDKVLAAKGLILDLRDNGGGSSNVGYAILQKLIDKPVEGSHWKTRQYLPAFRAWGREEQWYEGTHGTIQPAEGRRYQGPVAVLTGPATASAAEDFVVAFQTSGRGEVVGRRTLGSTGQPLQITLPGGGGARICTKRDTYPDGREFVGIGCIPDVEVVPTRADIAAGRDIVLEKAVAVLRTSSLTPPATQVERAALRSGDGQADK